MTRMLLPAMTIAALLGTPAAGVAQTPAGFCATLAPQLGMRQRETGWEVNPLGGLARTLFGGSAAFQMQVEPVGTDPAESQRLQNACSPANGLGCSFTGPARYTIRLKDKVATAEAMPGEKVDLTVARNRIRCVSAAG